MPADSPAPVRELERATRLGITDIPKDVTTRQLSHIIARRHKELAGILIGRVEPDDTVTYSGATYRITGVYARTGKIAMEPVAGGHSVVRDIGAVAANLFEAGQMPSTSEARG